MSDLTQSDTETDNANNAKSNRIKLDTAKAVEIRDASDAYIESRRQSIVAARDKMSYWPEFKTFHEYCKQVWGLSKSRAYEIANELPLASKTPVESKQRHVYVIQCSVTGVFKVGISIHPSRRMADLQAGYPYPLTLVHTLTPDSPTKIERSLHKSLSDFRLNGEWFDGYALQMVNWQFA
jgi:hypothetical protein